MIIRLTGITRRTVLYTSLVLASGCATVRAPSSGSTPLPVAGRADLTQVGRYRLTSAEIVRGTEGDSIYRFSDGGSSAAYLSVFRYDVPPGIRNRGDHATWTRLEGDKFRLIQPLLVQRGSIHEYSIVADEAGEVVVDGLRLFEHSIVVSARTGRGSQMDAQCLYVVGDRFLKVRGTFPDDTWQTGEFTAFSREVARRMYLASSSSR